MAGQGREASVSNTGFPSDESSDPRLSRPLVSPETHLLHGAIDSALLLPLPSPIQSLVARPPASQPASKVATVVFSSQPRGFRLGRLEKHSPAPADQSSATVTLLQAFL